MEKEALKRIFEFLEEKEEHRPPFMWKHMNDIPLTEDDLNIEGDLDLEYRNITSLPEGLKVNGYLDLSNTWIASLPEGLEVGSDLSLDYTMIEVLPKGLKVYGDLHIRRTRLKKYKYDELIEMIKPGFIFGNILS